VHNIQLHSKQQIGRVDVKQLFAPCTCVQLVAMYRRFYTGDVESSILETNAQLFAQYATGGKRGMYVIYKLFKQRCQWGADEPGTSTRILTQL
jgi:hypothetical protein